MNILAITYFPRGAQSQTARLYQHAIEKLSGHKITVRDLLKTPPAFFMEDNLAAYIKRNYMGETLAASEAKSIASMDEMAAEFCQADAVILAYPMYNFSMPGIVKAYFEAVMQKGVTWSSAPEKGYYGLMSGKKSLVLYAAGGKYPGDQTSWDLAGKLTEIEFKFMGFELVNIVSLEGVNSPGADIDSEAKKSFAHIDQALKAWQ